MEDKKEKPTSTRIQCDTGILGKPYSNHWKNWIFDIGIFTYFYKFRKTNKIDR